MTFSGSAILHFLIPIVSGVHHVLTGIDAEIGFAAVIEHMGNLSVQIMQEVMELRLVIFLVHDEEDRFRNDIQP